MIPLNLIDDTIEDDINLSGIQSNSKLIKNGNLFVAIDGNKSNGEDYIDEAVNKGAVAILTSNKGIKKENIPVIFNKNPRKKLSQLSKLFFPDSPEIICAVTGTNGKTSTADFLYQIWEMLGYNAATIGTLGVRSKSLNINTSNTTPCPIEIHQILDKLAKLNVSNLALEVSSHAIDQYRINSVDLESACFTNLSLDHMDYHKSINDYSNTKFKLFNNILPYEKTSVIYTDNNEGKKFFKKLKKLNRSIFDIGINAEKLKILSSENVSRGHKIKILYDDEIFSFNFNLQAHFQISNILCAAGLAITSGANYKDVFSVIENIKPVCGRMNIFETKNNSKIIIDYAHTPDALLSVLQFANSLSRKIILAFGCGGDRDISKRKIMGEIANKFSDKVIITNDNPRNEDPANIAKMIQKGCPSAQIILDRKKAIEYCLSEANSGDILIIAGKGHEGYQLEKGKKTYFSDIDVIKNFLENTNG
tara:strand:- start:417 stop:1847 length:1431 start_codon:yes stop_codon:yes gene_type:complete